MNSRERRVFRLLQDNPLSISEIASDTNFSKKEINKCIQALNSAGVNVREEKIKGKKVYTVPLLEAQKEAPQLKSNHFALTSDWHIGDRGCYENALLDYLDYCDESGVKEIVHSGDLFAGVGMYRGQLNDLKDGCVNLQGQIDLFDDLIPKSNKRKVYIISGNHDTSSYKNQGIDPVKLVSSKREDFEFLGQYYGNVKLPDGKVVELVHPSGGSPYSKCFSDDTEILTLKGWKLFKDVSFKDKVATRDSEGYLEWQRPTDIIKEDYVGDMLHFKARSFDLLVTPNHRLFVRRYPKMIKRLKEMSFPQKSHTRVDMSWVLVEAQDLFKEGLNFRQKWQMSKEVWWKGKERLWYDIPYRNKKRYASQEPRHFGSVNMDLFLEFLGWYISEGHTSKYGTFITQIRDRGRKKIKSLLDKLGWGYQMNYKRFAIPGAELSEELDRLCGKGAYNKRIPEFIKELSPRQIRIFLESAFEGGGTKDSIMGGWGLYRTVSDDLKDGMQELLLKCGYGATISKTGVSLSHFQNTPTINKYPEKVRYSGKVYCVEVPNHVILVRRNGRVIWSGNSYKIQTYLRERPISTYPDVLAMGHLHNSMYMDYQGTQAYLTGTFQGDSDYTRRRGLNPALGGWIVEVGESRRGKTKTSNEWVGYV